MLSRRQRIRRGVIIGSLLLSPITFYHFSPYVIIAGALVGVATGSMLLFALQFLSGLLLGRAFCGWACPAGGLAECLAFAQPKPAGGGRANRIKHGLWALWLIAVAVAIVAGGGLQAIDPLFMTNHGISLAAPEAYVVYYLVIGLIVALSLLAGRRAFCHYVCWMAPLMILGMRLGQALRLPRLCLQATPTRCIDCLQCNSACSMSLDVHGMVHDNNLQNDECILYGACADACPQGVLRLALCRLPGLTVGAD